MGVGIAIGGADAGASTGASASASASAGVGVGLSLGGRKASRERVLDDPREEEEGSLTVVPPPSNMALMEKSTVVRTELTEVVSSSSPRPFILTVHSTCPTRIDRDSGNSIRNSSSLDGIHLVLYLK